MNIYEKMQAITSELSVVAKNLEVGYGQSKYKATGEADVLHAVKPLEAKYKVYSYPVNRQVIENGTMENTSSNGVTKKNLFLRIETVYRFVNTEKPDEFIDITSYGDGVDSQDKAVGKAMTYSDKYALMKAYKIMTGDDPDQFASNDLSKSNTITQNVVNDLRKQMYPQESEEITLSERQLKWIMEKKNYTAVEQITEADKKWFLDQLAKKGK